MKLFKVIGVTAVALSLALSFSVASAATQADLEAKIKALESTLNTLKTDLQQVQATQAAPAQEAKLPGWVERMKFFGDLRLRWESTSYDSFKGSSKDGKDRLRTRLRFGVKSQIHEDVEVGLRMATGSDDDPTSTNQTNGNYFAEFTSWGVDQAYVKWTPGFIPEKIADLTVGKAKNPFVTTKVIWDGDVVPEGAFLNLTFNKKGTFQPFLLGTILVVEQAGEASDNLYAYAAQAGVKGEAGAMKYVVAAAYTDWQDLGNPGYLAPNQHKTPVYTNADGDVRTTNFKVWDFVAKGSFAYNDKGDVHAWAHYLNNADADGPYSEKDTAWGAGVGATYAEFGLDFWYKYVEADSTPGFIADSDSGYVNTEAFVVALSYKPWKYGSFTLSYFDGQNVDDDIQGATNSFQTFFLDCVFKF